MTPPPLPPFMPAKEIAGHLVALDLVPEPDPKRTSSRERALKKQEKRDQLALQFISNMGRPGLLPRSVSGLPAWVLHAAREICLQRAAGRPYRKIILPPDFNPGFMLSDLELLVAYLPKLASGLIHASPTLERALQWWSGQEGVEPELVRELEMELLPLITKAASRDRWFFFTTCNEELRPAVLSRHKALMEDRGWLNLPESLAFSRGPSARPEV